MGNEMMIQSYFNSTLVKTEKELPLLNLPANPIAYSVAKSEPYTRVRESGLLGGSEIPATAGKRRKSFKKKKGSKKKQNIK